MSDAIQRVRDFMKVWDQCSEQKMIASTGAATVLWADDLRALCTQSAELGRTAPWGWKLVPEKLTEDMMHSLRASFRCIGLAPADAQAPYEIEARYNRLWSDVLNIAPSGSPSATASLANLAARCRPAVRLYLTKVEMSLLGKYPEHYKPVLEDDANRARRLLDELDALIGHSEPHEPPRPPNHFPVA